MMRKNVAGMLVPVLGLAGLGACATTGTTEPGRKVCRPADAAALVGKAAPDDAAIHQATGSSIVRRIAPGDATTKDFREERVTVTITEGQVVAASCG
ncbi:Peptidase inhibitor I78 family protein [Sphingomonas gellani]|uniref:Peptidase inhibitor I78 family protein n=1 Tax=Sphingomonas gellani TaxID=1166340 RepID=A0A1H8JA88_9SPHN|nr:I78 family peptidase inhibitor [Sphingomonas gellani]SEN77345.1 Peptidase inhibitor I78 family protein [Sphingomonas gellani]